MAQTVPFISYAEYLAFEEKAETKHEYVDGRILAMSGGSAEHGRLSASFIVELGAALRGRRCVIMTSDVKIRVTSTGRATYPDVSVVCTKREFDPQDQHAVTNPVVLVEVLSDSTEASDRGEKFAHFRRISSLRHYVLVAQDKRQIEVYTRADGESWIYEPSVAGGTVKLDAIGAELSVDAIYDDPLEATPS